MREIDASIYQSNAILTKEGLEPVPFDVKYTAKFAANTIVHTVYGYGLIRGFRADSGLYEIDLALSTVNTTSNAYLLSNCITAFFQPIVKQAEAPKSTLNPIVKSS